MDQKPLPFENYSTNFLLRDFAFEHSFNPVESNTHNKMSMGGVVNKVYLLALFTLLSSRISWKVYNEWISTEINFVALSLISLWLASFIGFFAFYFKSQTKFIAPFTAFFLGFSIGPLSAHLDSQFPGVVILALILTAGIFEGILLMYQFLHRKKVDVFWIGVVGAVLGIVILYTSVFLLNQFGLVIPFPHELTIFLLIPLFIVLFGSIITMIASVEFIILQISKERTEEFEWYSAFALFISLVWLYVDLVSYLVRRRD
ncbi:Bax inhibitor-1/YccA family membrane protein [Gracilimonas sp.]|uniref:Bax inhibitor-1/YccA family membrane protein n=1 Tax=Gracilimonas sp. TaxID=1974203 RepID=UPI003BA8FFA9